MQITWATVRGYKNISNSVSETTAFKLVTEIPTFHQLADEVQNHMFRCRSPEPEPSHEGCITKPQKIHVTVWFCLWFPSKPAAILEHPPHSCQPSKPSPSWNIEKAPSSQVDTCTDHRRERDIYYSKSLPLRAPRICNPGPSKRGGPLIFVFQFP